VIDKNRAESAAWLHRFKGQLDAVNTDTEIGVLLGDIVGAEERWVSEPLSPSSTLISPLMNTNPSLFPRLQAISKLQHSSIDDQSTGAYVFPFP
jgi:hypothetical protein